MCSCIVSALDRKKNVYRKKFNRHHSKSNTGEQIHTIFGCFSLIKRKSTVLPMAKIMRFAMLF